MKRSTSAILLALAFAMGAGAAPLQAPPTGAPPSSAQILAPAPPPIVRPDEIKLMRDTLAASADQGFEPGAFYPPGLDDLLQSRDPQRRQRGVAQLLDATARYAAAVHRGRLSVGNFDKEWGMRPVPFDAGAGLYDALGRNQLKTWLDDLPPPYLGYQQLIGGLKTYRRIVADGGWQLLSAGPAMALGKPDPRVPALKSRLAAEYPDAAKAFADAAAAEANAQANAQAAGQTASDQAPAPDPLMFDPALDQQVKAFQTRHGLDPTGVVDKPTLAALNVPARERLAQIEANMERWRWAPAVMPTDRVQVNIAAAVMTLFRGDQPVLSMRAIAGRVTDHTPILQSTITSVEFNPPWNVPATIAAKEIWPKERAHPGYLRREDFITISTPDGGVRLQQKAGAKSALGQIKFNFDNRYGVYLHDTPSHSNFARDSRLVSHGCVRLDQPKALALMLLNNDPAWTADAIDALIADGKTKWVTLTSPTAVMIFYWTAFAGPDGVMNFRQDFYGWDSELMQRIAAGGQGLA